MKHSIAKIVKIHLQQYTKILQTVQVSAIQLFTRRPDSSPNHYTGTGSGQIHSFYYSTRVHAIVHHTSTHYTAHHGKVRTKMNIVFDQTRFQTLFQRSDLRDYIKPTLVKSTSLLCQHCTGIASTYICR